MSKKAFLSILLIALIMFGVLPLVENFWVSSARNGYEMSYSKIISEDTIWTKANSPINLLGNVLVSEGATLTIEAGVTVNCAKNVIQVNGTLKVQGNDHDKVIFTSTNTQISSAREQLANINFGDQSLGNVIEYAIFHTMAWTYYNCNNSITIDHVIIKDGATPSSSGFVSVLPTIRGSGTAIVTNSVFTSGFQLAISSTVINNTFSDAGISASDGSFIIANNTIIGTKSPVQGYGVSIERFQKAVISDNYISNYAEACIRLYDGPALIQRNFLKSEPNRAGYPFFGIEVDGSSPLIQNNTITNTGIGICLHDSGVILAKPMIRNNNIYGNEVWNIFLGYTRSSNDSLDYAAVSNMDAANNWWGTTDNEVISQSIRDSRYRSDLGTVTFSPFLTAQNPQATPKPNAPTPKLEQAPETEVIQATKDNGQKIELIMNGNLIIMWNSQVNITANPLTSSTNVTFAIRGWYGRDIDFGNITIPKSTIPYGNMPRLYLDNVPAQDQGYTEDTDNYYVWCTAHLDGYFYGPLTIVFASPSITTPLIIVAVAVALAIIIVILAWRIKKKP
jgi:L-rhamnose mutarotase